MILRSGELSAVSMAYRVLVLPEPVGPETRNRPLGSASVSSITRRTLGVISMSARVREALA